MQAFRLANGGLIDRSRSLGFTFDGQHLFGHPGDTLASALLANGIRLVGRSFKYHRPRGILSAGVEEPNALVELRTGARREANTRATVIELFDGLEAASQNRRGSLRFDLMAVNQWFAPFIAAGFYYKTFKWPSKLWEALYEPAIRRAAGLGRAAGLPDPDHYETAHAQCDVLVVGSGPAGLAAARAAGASGARVILAEQDPEFGGGLLLEPAHEAWRVEAVAALAAMPEVTLLPRTTVFGFYDHGMLGAVERVADHLPAPPPDTPRQRSWTIRARQVVLATGAHERAIAFPGNDRPGVMLAGAGHAYLRRWAVQPGHAAVLFATHDAAYAALVPLAEAGVRIVSVVDPRADSPAMQAAREAGFPVAADSEVCGTVGAHALRGVRIRRGSEAGAVHTADVLLTSGGWDPAINLASQSGAMPVWDERLSTFVPGTPVQAERSAGAARGVMGIAAAAADGAAAGAAAATAAGFTPGEVPPLLTQDPDPTPFPLYEVKARGKSFVDFQHDVTTADLRLAHQEGFSHIDHAKRYTTHGMATDQGKTGGLLGAAVLAETRGLSVAEIGLPRFRPFATPVAIGAIAGHEVGPNFQPERRTALHDWHAEAGCVWMDAGIWKRPAWYPREGDADAWASIKREARAVREKVGVCDVSTLGKIEVRGPDGATFLDRVYANTFSTLAIGRARYGLMLREDGMVFDDGTTSRLGPDRYFVTTTTANAGPVLAHLEFHLQTCWPELDVSLTSVTDQWASMSVAGPQARAAIAQVIEDIDLSDAAFPFMAVAECRAAGVPALLFRISFSGEMAYEIAVPAGHARHVWTRVIEAGATPYGVEALGLLRIEKGHVAGGEINGQTTAQDLGLGRMLKKRDDFIGRTLAQRPALLDMARPSLVGLRSLDPGQRLQAGAHLAEAGDGPSLGHVTSTTQSVVRPGWIGLGLLRDGAARIGGTMLALNPLMNETVPVAIVSPHHYDPENRRVRG